MQPPDAGALPMPSMLLGGAKKKSVADQRAAFAAAAAALMPSPPPAPAPPPPPKPPIAQPILAAAPPPPPTERRVAPDGVSYTEAEFIAYYGGRIEWEAANPNKKATPAWKEQLAAATLPAPDPAPAPAARGPKNPKPTAAIALAAPIKQERGNRNQRTAMPASQPQQQRGGRKGPAYAPVRQMMDDGSAYEGPMMRFTRPTGEVSSDEEDEPDGDDDDEDDEDEEEPVAAVSSLFAAAASLQGGGSSLPPVPPGSNGESANDPSPSAAVGREALLQVKNVAAETAALDASTSIGYTILKKMGWIDGQGLGRSNEGVVLPVAISEARLIEGVGLGCVNIPENKLLNSNVEVMINDFISDSTRNELVFDPDLDKKDRALIHVLAQKHNLGHKSQGKGKDRFLTVSKRGAARGADGARIDEAAIEEQFHRAHNSGYNSTMKGVGLGFGTTYNTVGPPKSLLKQCQKEAKIIQGLGSAQEREVQAKKREQKDQRAAFAAAAAALLPSPPEVPPPAEAAAAPPPPPPPAAPKPQDNGQTQNLYVSTLHGASSQFSPSDHSARQLLGQPSTYPKTGSSTKAWSAVPRAGQKREWVRVGFKRPLYPKAVTVYETNNPGSVVCIRGCEIPRGSQAEASDWFVMWSGECSWVDQGQARAFKPPLRPECMERLVSAVEITLDTSEWTEDFWTEVDAISLEGRPQSAQQQQAAAQAAAGALQPVETWLSRMPWECDSHFYQRARFERTAFGPTAPTSKEEGMRRSAISMAHQNMTILGCSYPSAVEEQVVAGGGGRRGGQASGSGMAVEGEMRAAAEQRAY